MNELLDGLYRGLGSPWPGPWCSSQASRWTRGALTSVPRAWPLGALQGSASDSDLRWHRPTQPGH